MSILSKYLLENLFHRYNVAARFIVQGLGGQEPKSDNEFHFTIDSKGLIREINGNVEQKLGFSLSDLTGKPILQIATPVIVNETNGFIDALEESSSKSVEYLLKNKQGHQILTRTSLYLTQKKFKPAYLAVFRESVPEFVHPAPDLLQNLNLSAVFRLTSDLMTISRLSDGLFIEVNQSLLTTLGFSFEEVIGKTSSELGIWKNESERNSVVEEIRQGKIVRDREVLISSRSGSQRTVLLSMDVLDHQGTQYLLSVAKDITAQREAERVLGTTGHDRTFEFVLSEKTKIQEELYRSEQKFRSLFEHADYGICITDMKTHEVSINPALERMLGYNAKALPNMHFLHLAHPDDFQRLNQEYSALRAGETDAFNSECRIMSSTGTYVHTVLFVGYTKNRLGITEYMIESILDITSRINNEIALTESESRYRSLFKNNSAVMLVVDPESGTIIDANVAAVDFYGYSEQELLRRNLNQISLTSPVQVRTELEQAASGKQNYFSSRHCRRNGKVTDVEIFSGPITLNGKAMVYYIVLDVTDRKEAEDGLNLLWNAIEHVDEGVMITDRSGLIKYINHSYAAFMGYTTEELIGNNPRIFNSGSQSPAFYEEMYNMILSGNNWQGQIVNKRKDGSLVDEFMVISPVLNTDGTIQHFISIKRDITRELQLEKELRHGEKMQAIGTLAGGIAHDFNNILQIIQIYSELLLPETSTDPFTEKNIKELNKAVNRGKELVHAILTYSRKTEIELVPQPCETLIRQSLAFIKAVLPPSVKIVENLSAAGNIMCNPNNIQQIIMNLATNSVTAMNEKGVLEVNLTETVDPEINTKVHHGPYAKLEIKDSGVGMNEETRRRIFEPFFTTKKVGNGTGLGLSTVLGIVEKHNGFIECDSTPGLGSTFKIFFPIISNYESTVLD